MTLRAGSLSRLRPHSSGFLAPFLVSGFLSIAEQGCTCYQFRLSEICKNRTRGLWHEMTMAVVRSRGGLLRAAALSRHLSRAEGRHPPGKNDSSSGNRHSPAQVIDIVTCILLQNESTRDLGHRGRESWPSSHNLEPDLNRGPMKTRKELVDVDMGLRSGGRVYEAGHEACENRPGGVTFLHSCQRISGRIQCREVDGGSNGADSIAGKRRAVSVRRSGSPIALDARMPRTRIVAATRYSTNTERRPRKSSISYPLDPSLVGLT